VVERGWNPNISTRMMVLELYFNGKQDSKVLAEGQEDHTEKKREARVSLLCSSLPRLLLGRKIWASDIICFAYFQPIGQNCCNNNILSQAGNMAIEGFGELN
jgi:hypothetical protein